MLGSGVKEYSQKWNVKLRKKISMNKYIKNKKYKTKAQKKAKKTESKWNFGHTIADSDEEVAKEVEENKKEYLEWIEQRARYMINGAPSGHTSPPKWFLKVLNRRSRSKAKDLMRHDRYDDVPPEKKTAGWDWW
jgi:hypothetical protein